MQLCTRFVAVLCGELTKGPENVAGLVGSSVTLSCAGTYLAWEDYTSVGNLMPLSKGTTVFYPNKYDLMTEPTGTYNLTIKSLELKQAGEYKCRTLPGPQYGIAEVVIFSGEKNFLLPLWYYRC